MGRGSYVRCPSCGSGNRAGDPACYQCGAGLVEAASESTAAPTSESTSTATSAARQVALEIEHTQATWRWGFHVAVLALAAWLAVPYFTRPAHYGVLDYAILPFHEAGHYFLMPFAPQFLVVAGGTLAQLGLPLGFAIYFLWRRKEPFAACVSGFWMCACMQNMAIYMKDARFLLLPLFGADPLDGHDWNYLFGKLHLLHQSVAIGDFFQGLGRLGMLALLATMLGLVIRQRPVRPRS